MSARSTIRFGNPYRFNTPSSNPISISNSANDAWSTWAKCSRHCGTASTSPRIQLGRYHGRGRLSRAALFRSLVVGALRSHPRAPCCVGDSATLVRDRRLGIRRVSRVLWDAADEIERSVKRLVVFRIRRDIGLRAGLLVAFGLKVSAQRSLAARLGARFELLRHLLQHLDVGRNAFRLDRTSGRGEIARGG